MRYGLAALLFACGCGRAIEMSDAAVDDAGARVEPPIAPSAPEPPRFACPTGWRSTVEGDDTLCEPWPTTVPSCGPLEIAHVGEGCRAAEACPTGAWPDDVDASAVYVRAGATGDGSRDHPFGTIAEGVARAGASGSVMIGDGTYRETLGLSGSPTLRGVCPERVTMIDPATTQQAPLVVRAGASAVVRGMRLVGANHGLWLLAGAHASVRGVVVEAPQPILVDSDGDLAIRDARVVASDPMRGVVTALPGTHVDATRVHLEGGFAGILAQQARPVPSNTVLALRESAIFGSGDALRGGLSGSVEQVAIEHVGFGLLALPGHELTLTDVRARDVTGALGFLGVSGVVHVQRVAITGVEDTSAPAATIAVIDAGGDTRLDGSDLYVAHTGNVAMSIATLGSVSLARVALMDVSGGVQLARAASLTLADLRVSGRASTTVDRQRPGHAIEVTTGVLVLDRAVLRIGAPGGVGLFVRAPGAATVHDVEVQGGVGLVTQCDSACDPTLTTLSVGRAHLFSVRAFGLWAYRTGVEVTDLDVDGVTYPGDVIPAFGVVATTGGRIAGTRIRVRAVEGAGVAGLENGIVALSRLEVDDSRAVHLPGAAEEFWGDALVCGSSGELHLDGFDSHGSTRAGLAISFACGPSTWRGTIFANAIGILNDERLTGSLDFSQLTMHDNRTPFDALTLDVPMLDPSF